MSTQSLNVNNSSTLPERGNGNHADRPSGQRNGSNAHPSQANKNRYKGQSNAKLSVPKPVILPSIRRETQGADQSAPQAPSNGGREAIESTRSTWSHPYMTPVRNHQSESDRPVLYHEDFPTLESAAQSKSKSYKPLAADKKTKVEPSERSPRRTATFPERQEEDATGYYDGSMQYHHPMQYPPYMYSMYYPHMNPYFQGDPHNPQHEYNGQDYYPQYIHPMYHHPSMHHAYVHPEAYADPSMHSIPHDDPTEGQSDAPPEKEEEVSPEVKLAAEIPNQTDEDQKGTGGARTVKRPSQEDGSKEILPRGQSLSKTISLSGQLSEGVEWEAVVQAEEAKEAQENAKKTLPASQERGTHDRWRARHSDIDRIDRWRPKHSPRIGAAPVRSPSIGTRSQKSTGGSDRGTPKSWRTPASQHQNRDPRPEWSPRGRRGRRGGRRGRQERPRLERVSVESAPATPTGRRLFPGRGFRPKGPMPRSPPLADVPEELKFGEFDESLKGDFDPFSKEAPVFEDASGTDPRVPLLFIGTVEAAQSDTASHRVRDDSRTPTSMPRFYSPRTEGRGRFRRGRGRSSRRLRRQPEQFASNTPARHRNSWGGGEQPRGRGRGRGRGRSSRSRSSSHSGTPRRDHTRMQWVPKSQLNKEDT